MTTNDKYFAEDAAKKKQKKTIPDRVNTRKREEGVLTYQTLDKQNTISAIGYCLNGGKYGRKG